MQKKLLTLCAGLMSMLMLTGCDATDIVFASLDLASAIIDVAS